jgi:hypothetical protein
MDRCCTNCSNASILPVICARLYQLIVLEHSPSMELCWDGVSIKRKRHIKTEQVEGSMVLGRARADNNGESPPATVLGTSKSTGGSFLMLFDVQTMQPCTCAVQSPGGMPHPESCSTVRHSLHPSCSVYHEENLNGESLTPGGNHGRGLPSTPHDNVADIRHGEPAMRSEHNGPSSTIHSCKRRMHSWAGALHTTHMSEER